MYIKPLSNYESNKIGKSLNIRNILLILVFVFTFILRAHNYDRVPTAAHLDEQLYAWSGIHLVQTGIPVSWSTLDYPERAIIFKGEKNYKGGDPRASVTLYKPWLDQPPLFSYLVGFFADRFGANKNDFIPSSYIRFPVIFISSIVSLLVYIIAKKIYGFGTGLFAMLVYGTVPLFVFASRTAMPENLISLAFLLVIYLSLKYREQTKMLYLLPIPFLAGFAGLAKPTGFFIVLFGIFVLFIKDFKVKRRKTITRAIVMFTAVIPFILFYFWYGYHFDKEIFLIVNKIQSFRPVGFASLAWFYISPAYKTDIFLDGWYVFALLSSVVFMFIQKKEGKIISFAFIFWILVVMVSGGEGDLLPWYRYPAFPLMAIMASWGITKLVDRADFVATFFVSGMLLTGRKLLSNPFHQYVTPMEYRLAMAGLLGPSIVYEFTHNTLYKKLSKFIIVCVVGVGIVWNILFIYNAFELLCESKTCPIVDSTWLSSLHFPFIWRFMILDNAVIDWSKI